MRTLLFCALLMLPVSGASASADARAGTLAYEVTAPLGRLRSMGPIHVSASESAIRADNRFVSGWMSNNEERVRLRWRYPPLASSVDREAISGIFRQMLGAEGITPPAETPRVTYGGSSPLEGNLGSSELYLFTFSSGTTVEIRTSRELPHSPLMHELMVQLAGGISTPTARLVAQIGGTPVSVLLRSQRRGTVELLSFRGVRFEPPKRPSRLALPVPFAELILRILP